MRMPAVLRRAAKRFWGLGLWAVVLFLLVVPYGGRLAGVAADFYADGREVLNNRVVVIDPGHGGIDSGARANGALEKELNLQLARQLRDKLAERQVRVIMTREEDIDFYTRGKGGKRHDLEKRLEIIENSGADFFISIHMNASRGAKWLGAQVFYNPVHPQNQILAERMQRFLADFPPGNKRQAKQDFNILVLNASNVPGVLIEAGFISNPREASLLKNIEYQRKMADMIVKALVYHISENEGS